MNRAMAAIALSVGTFLVGAPQALAKDRALVAEIRGLVASGQRGVTLCHRLADSGYWDISAEEYGRYFPRYMPEQTKGHDADGKAIYCPRYTNAKRFKA